MESANAAMPCLDVGTGVPVDRTRAAEYYQLSVDQGSMDAEYYFAAVLELGTGTAVNRERAIEYRKRSAGQGVAEAQSTYGVCHTLTS
jgi:TPR repeat protein